MFADGTLPERQCKTRVLATLATERLGAPVRPNDLVNASQSSNDVFPSAIHVAATREIAVKLIPALEHLAKARSAVIDVERRVSRDH